MLNKVVLIGRLTKDPELRYTTNRNATCSFTLACDRQFKNAQGEKETDFLSVSVPPFKKELAELCANYLSKGKMVAIDGSIRVRTYEKDGQKHWVTEVEAIDVRFLSPKDENAGTPAQNPQTQAQTPPPYSPPPYGAPPQQNYQQPGQPTYQQPPGAPTYPGQYAPPGYNPHQPPGYGQQPQGQWQAPPPGYQTHSGQSPHPNMPNPNFPNQQPQQSQWLGSNPPQKPPGAGPVDLNQIGRQVTLDDDTIPF